ncbi:MAG: type II secretion system inner membrane protein GspF [Pseudomonadota bacterium]
MPVFHYIGIDSKGKKVENVVDAENQRAARVKLRKLNIYPTAIDLQGSGSGSVSLRGKLDLGAFFKRVKLKDIAMMTRQLATLLGAHIPLVESLSALTDQVENVKLRSILTDLRERVTEGGKLSDALRGHSKVFGDLYVNMINAGENSGTLDKVCLRLADFLEGQAALRSKVTGAMTYPIIMAIVAFAMVILLLTLVVPKLTSLFTDVGVALPLPTRILITISDSLASYWYVFIILGGSIFFLIKRWLATPNGKAWKDKKILKLPVVGKLTRMVLISRFSRTLGTLMASGVPLLTAMDIVRNMITNKVLRDVIEETNNSVREGQSIAEPLKRSGEFPSLATHMIAIGEKTGGLEAMLEKVADAYDVEVATTVGTLTTLLEPIMILSMAVIVGFIVMAIMLPIMKLNEIAT